jgi:adenylylsulfate kinase-like enzyme
VLAIAAGPLYRPDTSHRLARSEFARSYRVHALGKWTRGALDVAERIIDVRGLSAKARRGELKTFAGIDREHPEIRVDTSAPIAGQGAGRIIDALG